MKSTPCFSTIEGQPHAILNWRDRLHRDDVILLQPLTPEQGRRYRHMTAQGQADNEIFSSLFPKYSRRSQPASVPFDELTKGQLSALISRRLNLRLPSLQRMSLDDLRVLCAGLSGR